MTAPRATVCAYCGNRLPAVDVLMGRAYCTVGVDTPCAEALLAERAVGLRAQKAALTVMTAFALELLRALAGADDEASR